MARKEKNTELLTSNREVEKKVVIINDINPILISCLGNPSDFRTRCLFNYVGGKTQFFDLMDPPYIKE